MITGQRVYGLSFTNPGRTSYYGGNTIYVRPRARRRLLRARNGPVHRRYNVRSSARTAGRGWVAGTYTPARTRRTGFAPSPRTAPCAPIDKRGTRIKKTTVTSHYRKLASFVCVVFTKRELFSFYRYERTITCPPVFRHRAFACGDLSWPIFTRVISISQSAPAT